MKKLRIVAAASILTVLLASSVHSQRLLLSNPGEIQWPKVPPGVYVGGRDGVTNPRVIHDVKPAYTPGAMRARVEGAVTVECVVRPDGTVGDVRVIKSLDSVFGLDDEAVKAAKQWRFVPGTKDGVAVPVLVSIELRFVLRDRGGAVSSLGWPDAFLSNSQTAVAAGEMWIDEVSEDSGVRVRFSYPHGWTFRREDSATSWFATQDDLRVLIVGRPGPAPAPVPDPLNTVQMERLKQTITQSLTARGSTAQLQATGQVHSANRLWFWYTLWAPASDPAFPSDAIGRLSQIFDGATVWAFMTTAGGKGITVSCYVTRPHGRSDADMNDVVRQAGAQFRAMLERMTIDVR